MAWREIIIHTLTVSVAQEFRDSLPGLFWLGVSHEVVVRCWLHLHLSEGWPVAGKPTLREALLHDSLMWCWLLQGILSSSPVGLSAGLLE